MNVAVLRTIQSWDSNSATQQTKAYISKQSSLQTPCWLFYFDDKGTFVSQINDSLNQVNDDYTMKLPFKQGSYQFVAWTGYDETCYQLSACIPQQTDIHDFFLSLKREKTIKLSTSLVCSIMEYMTLWNQRRKRKHCMDWLKTNHQPYPSYRP